MTDHVRPSTPPPAELAHAPAALPNLSAHYHASRLRNDTWSELKSAAKRLARAAEEGEVAEPLRARAERALDLLEPIESYWAFPGKVVFRRLRQHFQQRRWADMEVLVSRIVRVLVSLAYRRRDIPLLAEGGEAEAAIEEDLEEEGEEFGRHLQRPYFEVLVVDDLSAKEEDVLRAGLRAVRRPEDAFLYDVVVVPSFEDAILAVLFNFNLQTVVVRYDFPLRSKHRLELMDQYLGALREEIDEGVEAGRVGALLGAAIQQLRPELDLFLVTDVGVEEVAGTASNVFRRVFYRQEDLLELHLNILGGIERRYRTPFFTALRRYADQPTGVFHAMPISRGKSVLKSSWIRDMAQFYGLNIFMAETSSTSGGLDSLLDPRGTIKEAQEQAARAFGSHRTYFVTNGTSTANKIVVQSLVRPGDIVLVDRNCHKSHHYALMLAGAHVIYLDSYPLDRYSMYGAVPLDRIRGVLEDLEAKGRLDRVRLLLTNCTFDGVVYNPERVMEACLAIKPDLAFVWDEAWFAFACFDPLYRGRTGMAAARRLARRYRSEDYRARYEAADDKRGLPDPSRVRLRVYATQSTHKTLTSLRQGSMIHVYDQAWGEVEHAFHDAYMTHTSTSPNYQILASLDIGRRQVELEGFELVNKQVELAMLLREKVAANPRLARWFRFLAPDDLIPASHRQSGLERYYDADKGWAPMGRAWAEDEFVLDPCRLTLFIGKTGIDGDTFKDEHLMARHGIQVNKTSRNTVLFMTNIGTTRSSVAHLIEVLTRMADRFDEEHETEGPASRAHWQRAVHDLSETLPPLPDFSRFHPRFVPDPDGAPDAGDLRAGFFLAADEGHCDYIPLDDLADRLRQGRTYVAAGFVTPYPPGFPVLVPGQEISEDIVAFLRALDVREIHGYQPTLGIRVLKDEALEEETT